jgi:hypothetical protein
MAMMAGLMRRVVMLATVLAFPAGAQTITDGDTLKQGGITQHHCSAPHAARC